MKTSDRLTALERSAALHDKQIKAIRDLMQEGMRIVVQTRKEARQFRRDLNELAAHVSRMAAGRRSNGHGKRKIDLN